MCLPKNCRCLLLLLVSEAQIIQRVEINSYYFRKENSHFLAEMIYNYQIIDNIIFKRLYFSYNRDRKDMFLSGALLLVSPKQEGLLFFANIRDKEGFYE
ncbi:hypothetical protein GMA19_04847 [Paenibacillus polymyxa E681]|nr:hypothetical protein GE561_04858 [Paenibacillus polymyxa E681]QNV64456.1 hypothetical protein GMA19_04847 [Paenibacillus polymyxa E681]